MNDLILKANQEIDKCYRRARELKEFISAFQKICEHVWVDAPECYDYHKREDYSKCEECGLVR